jgi:hypothetical protein
MHPKSHLLPLMISTDKEMKKKFIWGKHLGKKMVVGENIFEFKIYCLNN